MKIFFACLTVGACLVSCHGNGGRKQPIPSDTAAFGAAHFGVTDKVYKETLKGDTVLMLDNTVVTLKPYFIPRDRRLYALRLVSPDQPADKFKTRIMADMNSMIQQMVNLYGGPTQYFSQPKIGDLEPNQLEWYCSWELKNKQIRIGIARMPEKEGDFGDNRRYIALCQIANKALLDVAHSQQVYLDMNPSLRITRYGSWPNNFGCWYNYNKKGHPFG